MRVVVKIPNHAYAELVAELERIPPRERAERMRLLASVGMTYMMRDQAQLTSTGIPAVLDGVPENRGAKRFQEIRARLTKGF